MNSNRIIVARAFAHDAHDSINQKRKCSGVSYWVHTDAVASLVEATPGTTEDMVIAALLHDVVEDVAPLDKAGKFQLQNIEMLFGKHVALMVDDLTDKFTKEAYPKLNRVARKALEHDRLLTISYGAKVIKLADIIDNTIDIVSSDPDFARVYLREVWSAIHSLEDVNLLLWTRARDLILESAQKANTILE